MTVEEAQPTVDLVIQSDMAGRLVALCRVFERLPLIPVDCAGIEAALSVVTVPLPAARLTEDEKAFFDRFCDVGAHGRAPGHRSSSASSPNAAITSPGPIPASVPERPAASAR